MKETDLMRTHGPLPEESNLKSTSSPDEGPVQVTATHAQVRAMRAMQDEATLPIRQCLRGEHEAEPDYMNDSAMTIHRTESIPEVSSASGFSINGGRRVVVGTGLPVRLCRHCRCLYVDKP